MSRGEEVFPPKHEGSFPLRGFSSFFIYNCRIRDAFSQPANGPVAVLRYRVAFGSGATKTRRAKETKQGGCSFRTAHNHLAERDLITLGAALDYLMINYARYFH